MRRLSDRVCLENDLSVITNPKLHSMTRIGRKWGMTQSYIDLLTRHKVKLLCIRDRLLFDENGAAPILTIKNAECPL